jgi:hypothetical protein
MPKIDYKRVKYEPGVFASQERQERELIACIQKQGDDGWDLKAAISTTGILQRSSVLLIFGRTAGVL